MRENQSTRVEKKLSHPKGTPKHTLHKNTSNHTQEQGRNCTKKHKKATSDPRTNNHMATLSALTKVLEDLSHGLSTRRHSSATASKVVLTSGLAPLKSHFGVSIFIMPLE